MYLLRWRFDFSDGRVSRFGMWSRPATRREDMAAYVNTSNLARASVEAKHIETRKISTIAECDGADYVTFQWLSSARFSGIGNQLLSSSVYGLRLISRDACYDVHGNGTILTKGVSDQIINFNYGAGL